MNIAEVIRTGIAFHQSGRIAEAESQYRAVLARDRSNVDALLLLGVLCHDAGRFTEAVEILRRAAKIRSNNSRIHNSLGKSLLALSQLDEALAAFNTALALAPDYADAAYSAANALRKLSRLDEAVALYRKAIALKTDFVDACINLGNTLSDQGQFVDAIEMLRTALQYRPNDPLTQCNLVNTLHAAGRTEEALDRLEGFIATNPTYPDAHVQRANIHISCDRYDDAITSYRRAIALNPNHPEAHMFLGATYLVQGDFLKGWPEKEWRWKCSDRPVSPGNFQQPQWDGSPLDGKTILLHGEQGMGDRIQFVRYAPLVAQRGAKVLLQSHPQLLRLFRSLEGPNLTLLAEGQNLPAFDIHCPLLSLPLAFGTNVETVPNTVPYLLSDPADVATWKTRLAADIRPLKIGIVWGGNPANKHDRQRSAPLAAFAPLFALPDVTIYSLQMGSPTSQIDSFVHNDRLIDHTSHLRDFADTAAFIANLDVVVSICTSVAHLAGALGKRTYTVLAHQSDWRWLRNCENSPWYPTMRLFRRAKDETFTEVLQRVAAALRQLQES